MKLRTALFRLNLLATASAALMAIIAWQHNPQGEFHGEGRIHYPALAAVFLSWWGLILACGSPLIFVQQWIRSRRPDE